LVPDSESRQNKDMRKETTIQKSVREMKEKHMKEMGIANEEKEEPLIEELDSKEFQQEIEQGMVQPK